MSMDKSIFRNFVFCYQNRNLLQDFSGDKIISKDSKKLSQVEPVFDQNRPLLNSITDDFMTVFLNDGCTKIFGRYPGKHLQLPFNEIVQLESAVYYWTTDTSLEVLRREKMF